MMGITKSGDKTENLVESLCKNVKVLKRGSALGDAEYVTEGEEFYIEIKKTTLNQVRPYKYIPVVAYNPDDDDWFVIPPDDILDMASKRKGQHTLNPFVCIGLGKVSRFTANDNPRVWDDYHTTPSRLEDDIVSAFRKGESSRRKKRFAQSVLKTLKETVMAQKNEYGSVE
tara:strand:+ start:267 stop:779 length:513 start_codon:yes stop_codon:yes gene_type:complete